MGGKKQESSGSYLARLAAVIAVAGTAVQMTAYTVASSFFRVFNIDPTLAGITPLNAALKLINTGRITVLGVLTIGLAGAIIWIWPSRYINQTRSKGEDRELLIESLKEGRWKGWDPMPWTDSRLKSVWLALPPRSKIVMPLGTGCGLRQGEMFGLSPDDVDRAANLLRVVRQVQQVDNRLVFCLPKGDKERNVPLPAGVLREMDAYARTFQPVPVTLPWEEADGKPVTVRLYFTDDEGRPWWRQTFNADIWKPALKRAEVIDPTREDGTHALRHFYASALLDGGESIKAVSEYLGHADAGFTLRTYTHLMPSSHERTRRVIDNRLGRSDLGAAPDGPATAQTTENEKSSRSTPPRIRTGSRGTG